jgi:hypothetical protein
VGGVAGGLQAMFISLGVPGDADHGAQAITGFQVGADRMIHVGLSKASRCGDCCATWDVLRGG